MNDADLRQRFDALTTKIPAQPDAYSLVRIGATRLRRRRGTVAVAGVLAVVGAAVGVPAALHQAQPPSSSAVGGLSTSCDPAAAQAAGRFGTVERMYGTASTAAALAAWRVHIGGVGAALPPGTPVSLCLLVGDLDRARPGPGVHYLLLSVISGTVQEVYMGDFLPDGDPMPGVARSRIKLWSGPVATRPRAAATTASAAPLTTVPLPSLKATSTVAPAIRPCTSHELAGRLGGVGLADGLPQGAIEIWTTSPAGCVLRGNLHLFPLTSGGAVLPVPRGGPPAPTDGVYAPLPVDSALAPLSARQSSPQERSGQILVVEVGDDAGGACLAKDRETRPVSFRLTIGAAVVTIKNLASGDLTARSLIGCPGGFYAGAATLN